VRWTTATLALIAALALASEADAQTEGAPDLVGEPTIVGIVGGWAINEGLWTPEAEGESVGGVILGGFVNARTPASWFSVRAEVMWVQRGFDVTSVGGDPLTGGVRSDYITFAIHPRASVALGPVRLHLAGGPTLDQLVQSRVDSSLGPILYRDVPTVFGVGLGAGLGGIVASRYRVELEVRFFEGLGDAYSGDFISVRNRSLEFLTRVGIPKPGS